MWSKIMKMKQEREEEEIDNLTINIQNMTVNIHSSPPSSPVYSRYAPRRDSRSRSPRRDEEPDYTYDPSPEYSPIPEHEQEKREKLVKQQEEERRLEEEERRRPRRIRSPSPRGYTPTGSENEEWDEVVRDWLKRHPH